MKTNQEKKMSGRAHVAVNRAVKAGKLIKPTSCQTCNRTCKHIRLGGHHHRGYDFPLDVWWICQRCNSLLRKRHDGSLSIDTARNMVNNFRGFCEKCHREKLANPGVLERYRG
jgi:hypothetical protein